MGEPATFERSRVASIHGDSWTFDFRDVCDFASSESPDEVVRRLEASSESEMKPATKSEQ
jgi:hypothetical protein